MYFSIENRKNLSEFLTEFFLLLSSQYATVFGNYPYLLPVLSLDHRWEPCILHFFTDAKKMTMAMDCGKIL